MKICNYKIRLKDFMIVLNYRQNTKEFAYHHVLVCSNIKYLNPIALMVLCNKKYVPFNMIMGIKTKHKTTDIIYRYKHIVI